MNFSAPGPMPGSNSCNQAGDCEEVFSYAMFRDLERAKTPFSGIGAHRTTGISLSLRDEPMTGDAVMVSGQYFPVLGINAARGRLLGPDDDNVVGANFVAVVSYNFWRNELGEDPDVLGKPIVINGKTFSIVGVAPQNLKGLGAAGLLPAMATGCERGKPPLLREVPGEAKAEPASPPNTGGIIRA